MDIYHGTGRYLFEYNDSNPSHVTACLIRRAGSDSRIDSLRFYRDHDSIYVERCEVALPDLLEAYFRPFPLHFLSDCSLDVLSEIAQKDKDYPYTDLLELRFFCDKYHPQIMSFRPKLAQNMKTRFPLKI